MPSRSSIPAWSPDGKQLAFSTDRFSTKLQTLEAGDLRLAVMDVAIGQRARGRRLRRREEHQPAVDARRPGALLPLRSRRHHEHLPHAARRRDATQLTNLLTGVSGITELEPGPVGRRTAGSCSAPSRTTATTIYALESAEQLAGGAAREPAD